MYFWRGTSPYLSISCPVHLPYCLMMETIENACSPGMAVKGCHCSGEMPLLLTYTSCGANNLTLSSSLKTGKGASRLITATLTRWQMHVHCSSHVSLEPPLCEGEHSLIKVGSQTRHTRYRLKEACLDRVLRGQGVHVKLEGR